MTTGGNSHDTLFTNQNGPYFSAPKLCFLRDSCAFCHTLELWISQRVEVEQRGANMTTGGNSYC